MGLRFRKSISIAPWLRINFSKTGPSVSLGKKGATINLNPKGTRATVGIPGTGVSYSENITHKTWTGGETSEDERSPGRKLGTQIFWIVVGCAVWLFFKWLS